MFKSLIVAAAIGAAGLATPSFAATITPVGVTATSTFWTYNVNNLINGSGLSGGLHDSSYTTHWMTDLGVAQAQLVFDLGSVYDLASADIWQFNYADGIQIPGVISTLDRGVTDFRILTSLDGVTFTQAFAGTMARETGAPAAAQTFAFSGSAQYVMLDLLGNYAAGTIYDPYATGLGEVRFNSVAAVPEPATWAMMIAGFGIAGSAMRRRKVALSFA